MVVDGNVLQPLPLDFCLEFMRRGERVYSENVWNQQWPTYY